MNITNSLEYQDVILNNETIVDLKLVDKLVVVTGAARGIGAETAKVFVQEGARVLLVDLNEEVKKLADDLNGDSLVCDLTDTGADERVSKTAEKLGGASVLINNAGISKPSPFPEITDKNWAEVMDVNLGIAFRLTRSLWSQLSKNNGSVVNLASFASKRSTLFGNNSSYVAAKHAISGLTRATAFEGATQGIRVNAVAPGTVDTELIRSVHDADTRNKILKFIPQNRFADTSEIADVIAFLASPRASHICGEIVNINGGMHMD